MPEGNQGQRGPDMGEQLLARFTGALVGKALGDVPEKDKLSAIEGLTAALEELVAINRICSEMLWDKFGNEETGEFVKKPDLRDFMSAWAAATTVFLGELAEAEEGGAPEEGLEEGGSEEDDGQPEGLDEGAPTGEGPVIDGDFKVLRPGKRGK